MQVSIHGREFEVADEPADFWGWVKEGRYDHEWMTLDRCLKPEHTFVDVGAWVGSHSLYASRVAKRVIAIEPDPVAFAILGKNAQGEGIEITSIAIADRKGEMLLGSGWLGASTTRENLREGNGIGAAVPDQMTTAPCMTLREFCKPLKDPLFIKIDIEGAEEHVVKDPDFFRERRPTVYLETHPFWWRNEPATWEHIRTIAAMYEEVFDHYFKPFAAGAKPTHLTMVA